MFVDIVPVWAGVCDRAGENLQILLPVAQGQGQRGILRGHPGGAAGLAHHRHVRRAVRLRRLVQVSNNCNVDCN